MKTLITLWLVSSTLLTSAQTIVKSMQTSDNAETLSMNIVGKRDGRPFRHTIRYDVAGMSKTQRDSLYQHTLRTLDMLGIRNVPGMKKPESEHSEPRADVQSGQVTFRCETCTGKGRVEVYGNDFMTTRSSNAKRDTQSLFPLTMQLSPDEYMLMYWQNGDRQKRLMFSIKPDKENVITLK